MNSNLTLLVVRHVLALAGGALTAHGIDATSTISLIIGVVLFCIPTLWSWIAKVLHIDDSKGALVSITGSEVFRTLLGSLASQIVTAATAYFAVDGNDPALLIAALINAGVSKFDLHQKIAHVGTNTMEKAAAMLVLSFTLSACFSSCSGVMAYLASPAGRATTAAAVQISKDLAKKGEAIVLKKSIDDLVATLAKYEAQTKPTDIAGQIILFAKIDGLKAALIGAQQQYKGLTGLDYPPPAPASAKQPLIIAPTPATTALIPMSEPACLAQRRIGIPLYGERVAFLLANGAVR